MADKPWKETEIFKEKKKIIIIIIKRIFLLYRYSLQIVVITEHQADLL
jgi:hypothetical protein